MDFPVTKHEYVDQTPVLLTSVEPQEIIVSILFKTNLAAAYPVKFSHICLFKVDFVENFLGNKMWAGFFWGEMFSGLIFSVADLLSEFFSVVLFMGKFLGGFLRGKYFSARFFGKMLSDRFFSGGLGSRQVAGGLNTKCLIKY